MVLCAKSDLRNGDAKSGRTMISAAHIPHNRFEISAPTLAGAACFRPGAARDLKLKLRATRQPAVPAASLALALSTHAQGRDELALAPGSRRPPPHDSRPTALVSTPCAAPCEGKPVHGYAQTRLELELNHDGTSRCRPHGIAQCTQSVVVAALPVHSVCPAQAGLLPVPTISGSLRGRPLWPTLPVSY